MEMEIWMDSLLLHQHLQLNPPPSPSPVQEAISSYYNYYPPYAAAAAAAAMTSNNRRDTDVDVDPTPQPQPLPSRTRAAARKDRHSKICTAGGMRDRRMRLSLDVARRFFSLQDKLGFDKASKTVQWLLDMSTAGINHLLAASATSTSEDGSGSVLLDLDSNDHIMVADAETNNCKMPTKARRRAGRKSNNGVPALLPDKESRARARQRARVRTIERIRLRSSTISSTAEEAPAPAPAATQVISPVIPPGSSSFGSCYEEQEPWELGGVVFAKPRFRY